MQVFGACCRELQLWIGYGFAERGPEETVYNTWVMLGPQGQTHLYRKSHLHPFPQGSRVNERQLFKAGDVLRPFRMPEVTAGVMICYDGCFPEVGRALVLQGADIILWPNRSGGYLAARTLPQVRALDNTVPVVLVEGGQEGGQLPLTAWSVAASPRGEVLCSHKNQDAPFRLCVDCEEGARLRAAHDAGAHCLYVSRRPDLYAPLTRSDMNPPEPSGA